MPASDLGFYKVKITTINSEQGGEDLQFFQTLKSSNPSFLTYLLLESVASVLRYDFIVQKIPISIVLAK